MNKRRIITIMICMGLVTLGTTSVMAEKTNLNMNIAQSVMKLGMLIYNEENTGIATGGILHDDSYEIEILDGSRLQIRKIDRLMRNINTGSPRIVHIKNVDLKITYNKWLIDEGNLTEVFATFLYEKDSFDLINGSEIVNKPHTVIIEGFTGWLFTMGAGSWNLEENGLGDFWFMGNYENIQIIEGL